MKGDHLGEFEELVLLAVHGLEGEAYGVPVQQLLERETHRSVSLGAVYQALERLEAKSLVRSEIAAGTAVRGGRSRRVFQLSAEGVRSLQSVRQVRDRLYSGAGLRSARGRS